MRKIWVVLVPHGPLMQRHEFTDRTEAKLFMMRSPKGSYYVAMEVNDDGVPAKAGRRGDAGRVSKR